GDAVGPLGGALTRKRVEHVANHEAVRDDENGRLRAGEHSAPAADEAARGLGAALAAAWTRLLRTRRPSPLEIGLDRTILVATEVDLPEIRQRKPRRVRRRELG